MGFGGNNKKGPISEINVTPLVDVMLVLLVIFMITAPLMYSGVKLQLPKTKKVDSLKLTTEQIILSITPSGEFYLGKEKFLEIELYKVIVSKLSQSKSDVLYIRAHYDLRYGAVAKLISSLKKSGISNIALVTEIENKNE